MRLRIRPFTYSALLIVSFVILTRKFPRNVIDKIMLQSLKLSENVQNIFTFTGHTGYVSETGSQNGQYSSRDRVC